MTETSKTRKSDADWQAQLDGEQYRVCRQKGTERPFTGAYWDFWEEGRYYCVCCGSALFDAETKFDAGCGWPSFSAPVTADAVAERRGHQPRHDPHRSDLRPL